MQIRVRVTSNKGQGNLFISGLESVNFEIFYPSEFPGENIKLPFRLKVTVFII